MFIYGLRIWLSLHHTSLLSYFLISLILYLNLSALYAFFLFIHFVCNFRCRQNNGSPFSLNSIQFHLYENAESSPFWNQKETQFNKNAQKILYPNLGYIRQHPVFWSRELINSKYTPFVFGKNQGQSFKFQQKNRRALTQKNDKRREILQCYRHCFLVFLKHLENNTKFHGLVHLHFKKFMSTKFFYKHKESFSRTLAFRVMKPPHLEISYKLFHVIYL